MGERGFFYSVIPEPEVEDLKQGLLIYACCILKCRKMAKNNKEFRSDLSEDFHAMREESKRVKKLMRDDRVKSIYAHIVDLQEDGIESFKLNDYQYRFVKNGHKVDYFPTSGKYHDITLNKRGTIPAFKLITLFV